MKQARRWLLILSLLLASVTPFLAQAGNLGFGRALNDAWFNPETPGQGFFIMASDELQIVFIGWETFPSAQDPLSSLEGAQRWYTLLGNAQGSIANLDIRLTTGGELDGSQATTTEVVGQASLQLMDCNNGRLEYQLTSIAGGQISGVINLRRIVQVDESLCDDLLIPDPLPAEITAASTMAIRDVNLLPMSEGPELIEHQTVVISGGEIVAMGPRDSVVLPDDAVIVDGRGRYLMPGLIDTHTHLGTNVRELLGLSAPLEMTEISAKQQLMLYLANGVTSILNNGDFGEPLARWGRETINGEKVGPTIFSAQYARGGIWTPDGGPDIRTVTNAEQAKVYTRNALQRGYRLMKIYNNTPREAVLAIMEEASRLNMPVIGHFPQTMNAEETISRGLSVVAHAAAYVYSLIPNLDLSQIQPAVSLTLDNNLNISSTLWIEETIAQVWGGNQAGVQNYWARAENRYMDSTTRGLNERSINGRRWNPLGAVPGGYNNTLAFIRQLVLKMHQGGVRLFLGTDSPTVLGVPGFSAHDEMEALHRVGISNTEVLKIATRNGGEYLSTMLDLSTPLGALTVGAQADMVLLSENPLESINNTRTILGVISRGYWRSSVWFDDALEEIAEINNPI